MIARGESYTECEQILLLLSPYMQSACVRDVFADISEIQRLLELYSFRTPQLADRFADLLTNRYRYEIFALYGETGSAGRQTDSSYLRLTQLLSSLIRVAIMRLCCEGTLSLTRYQLTQSDGLLLLALRHTNRRG